MSELQTDEELAAMDDEEQNDAGMFDPDTDDEEPDANAEQSDTSQVTPEEMEKRYKALDRAVKTYVSKIADLLEEQATDLIPCPLCSALPHPGFVNQHDAGRVPDEISDVTKHYLGLARPQEFKASIQHNPCAHCDGLGKVTTGSRVAQWETLTCPNCKGYGFMPPPGSPATAGDQISAAQVMDAIEQATVPQDDRDPSGEPRYLPDGRENPNYGKWPQFKIQVPPWGTTANLTAQDA